MDPLTATITLITFASFIKDLIEIGQNIQRSIEKARPKCGPPSKMTIEINQENLKAEMLHVLSLCCKISPVQRPGFRGVGSQVKVWMKRDDVEKKIGRLKEHVNKCYLQFTAFSAARIEQTTAQIKCASMRSVNTTLRVEQRLIVNNVENQVRLRRLEELMTRVLLETQFGQNVLNQTMEIIVSDSAHRSEETQFLSAQTMRLIDSIQKLRASGNLNVNVSLWDRPRQLVFSGSTSTLHVLHKILGMVLVINDGRTGMQVEFPWDIMANLGVQLDALGMISEGIAWNILKIHILHSFAGQAYSIRTWAQIADSLTTLSIGYQHQLQFEPALRSSQQSLELWRHLSGNSPDVDNHIGLLASMATHAHNLLETGQAMAALTIAEEAVTLSRSTIAPIIESDPGLLSWNEEYEFAMVRALQARLTLAKAFSSVGRHLESYAAFNEGFHLILRWPPFAHPPSGADVDSLLDQICKVAEREEFSLHMLADCVVLFRNLARRYPVEISSQFLWLLHAYVYFSQQDTYNPIISHSLRSFLEPNSDCPPPELDIRRHVDFSAHGGIIKDAVLAFYTCPSETTHILIRNLFVTHFDEALLALREVVKKSCFESITMQWALYSISDIILFVSNSNRVALLQTIVRTIEHCGTILTCRGSDWEGFLDFSLIPIFHRFWSAGLLETAFTGSEEVIQYLQSRSDPEDPGFMTRLYLQHVDRLFVLCDMGRISDAIEAMQQIDKMFPADSLPEAEVNFLLPCIIKTRILRRAGRKEDVLRVLKKGVTAGTQKYWTDAGEVFDLHLYFLLVELAAAWGQVGKPKKALKDAERAVAACRKVVDEYVDGQKCALIHSLTALSNCLAAVRQTTEAVAIAQEAVSIYTQNVGQMWDSFVYTIRKEEMGANAFHALSLRLATSGETSQALAGAEKATELYRELVALAPRYLPDLASSLRNVASIRWEVGRRDEAITACEEAVCIMRKVADTETNLLPALAEALGQLLGYHTERSTAAEYAEVQGMLACLPPQPHSVLEMLSDDEDDGDSKEFEETMLEADDRFHIASTAEVDANEVPELSANAALQLAETMESSAAIQLNATEKEKGTEAIVTSLKTHLISYNVSWMLVGLLSILVVILIVLVGILSLLVGILWVRTK
ncbi:Tetratricopeptide repeat family [Mycena venus]|uniref:Tetratricopeptide repeat family n=1 Tax=Mycena venus TaxID=2733690 RepID=A0A8H6YPT5_9AGAR|nr:Tetratricopeptide repeat family [Mycena venus]